MLKKIVFTYLALLACSAHAEPELRTLTTGSKFQCTANRSVDELKKKINGFPVLCVVKDDVFSSSVKKVVIPANSRLLGWTEKGYIIWTSWQTPEGKLVEGFSGLATSLKSGKTILNVVAVRDVEIWF